MPTRAECISLLRENGCDDEVIRHCEAVSALAVKIARKCGADVALVEVGGLLHDIGRCKTHEIAHAVEGAKVAKELDLPDPLVKIIERHIGAGISSAEAKRLGLPGRDFTPRTVEEMIVAHADNLMAGSRRTSVNEAVAHLARKGQHEPAMKIFKLHEKLSGLCGVDLDEIP